MYRFMILPALLLAAAAHAEQQPRKLDTFYGINVKGPLNMKVEVGKAQSVTVSGDPAFIGRLETVVEGGVLRITYDNDGAKSSKGEQLVIVTVPTLTSFRLKGAGEANLHNIGGERIDISFEGAGALHADGNVKLLRLKALGVGEVNTRDLKTLRSDVNFDGMGDVLIHASDTLNLVTRGMGSVKYYGHPKHLNKSLGGIGSVGAGD
jgi:hypothetical protein